MIVFLLFLTVWGVEKAEFCTCDESGCVCDDVAYLSALKAAFEVEKDEWRQEFQAEKALWLDDQAAPPSEAAALRQKHAAEVRAQLELLQFPDPERCDTLPVIHFNYRQMGLGAAWHGMTLVLTYAMVTHRTVVVDPQPVPWVWGDTAGCGLRTHDCWFEPLTNCRAKLEIEPPKGESQWTADHAYKEAHVEYDWWAGARKQYQPERLLYMKGSVWGRGNGYVPARYEMHGLMWWRAQLMAFVLRPRPETLAAIADARVALGLEGRPYVGVHVRRGAKWREAPFVPLATYMDAVRAHAERAAAAGKPVPKDVFLATDATDVVEEFRRDYGDEFHFIYREETYRHSDKNVTWMAEIRRRWAAASTDAVDLIRDVWFLAEADYVVCTYSSNVGRTVAELRYAWTNTPPGEEITSLDKPYLVDP